MAHQIMCRKLRNGGVMTEGMGSVTHSCSAVLPPWPIPTCRMAARDQRQKLIHGSSTETKILKK